MLPAASSVTPGISLLSRTRGPIPERNKKLPTRFACGNAPTGSGARELSKDLLICQKSDVAVLHQTSRNPSPARTEDQIFIGGHFWWRHQRSSKPHKEQESSGISG